MSVSYLKKETSPQQAIFNKEDWSSAYCNVEKELDHAELKLVKGSIPEQISGIFLLLSIPLCEQSDLSGLFPHFQI